MMVLTVLVMRASVVETQLLLVWMLIWMCDWDADKVESVSSELPST